MTDYWKVFSRWLSQVRETTSSLLQVSLYFLDKKKKAIPLVWGFDLSRGLPGPRLILYLALSVTLPLLATEMFVKGESCGRAGSCVAFPNLRSYRQHPGNARAEAVTGEYRQVSYLYPRYWQVETENREFQVSAQAVRRVEPTWNWRRLDPFTFKNTEKRVRKSVVHI